MVKHVLKKRDRIVSSLRKGQARYLTKSHKFGIEVTKTVEQAVVLHVSNDKTLWADVIAKELQNVKVTVKILADWTKAFISHLFV